MAGIASADISPRMGMGMWKLRVSDCVALSLCGVTIDESVECEEMTVTLESKSRENNSADRMFQYES